MFVTESACVTDNCRWEEINAIEGECVDVGK